MSVIEWAKRQRQVKGAAHHLLLLMATEADDFGSFRISVRGMVERSGYHQKTVRRLISRLEQSGYLIVVTACTGNVAPLRRLVTGDSLASVDPRASRRETQRQSVVTSSTQSDSSAGESDRAESVVTSSTLAEPRTLDDVDGVLLLALIRQAKDGGVDAESRILALADMMIQQIAWRKLGHDAEFDDRVQDGRLGVVKAIQKFEPDRGFPFGAFARRCIESSMVDQIEAERLIKVPRKKIHDYKAVAKAQDELARELGRDAEPEEVAKRSQLPLVKVKEMMSGIPSVDPTDILDDVGPSPEEGPLDTMLGRIAPMQIRRMVDDLGEPGASVLRLKYGLDGEALSIAEIAEQLGLTEQRVQTITQQSIAALQTRPLAEWAADNREHLSN